ncbi:leucine-rich repeat protein [Hoylesella timonensis]|uniref:leucine-rich repeat domain-containing protein n=1 Tax=Hoylesella timonensis TaxID=386414 RepID=UPI003369F77B
MKQNYNNKTKLRSAWFALVLLMLTALPITAQNVGDRFQVDGYYYEVVDATKHTVKLTYGNKNLNTAQARDVNLTSSTDELANDKKGYNGTPKVNLVEEYKIGTFSNKTPDADQKHNISLIKVPATVKNNNDVWKVVAIGSYAFINERGIDNVELPEGIEAIEDAAFYQCSVTMINFPKSLKYIGWRAFYKTNLEPYSDITTKSNKSSTKHMKNLQPIIIPGKTAIGPQAFEGSFSVKEFKCPQITFVGYQAFKGDKFKITTPIPKAAKIGEQPEDNKIKAMYNNLPAGTDQRSGVESFAEFSGTVSLDEGPTTIPTGMFEKAFTNLANFFIPLSVVNSIDERAFSNAGILSFNALSEVKRIGARAFENGVISGDFVIREQVEEVGDGAFAGNVKLTGFTLIGSTNCKVGAEILEGCPNLEYVDLRNVKNEDFKKNLKNLSREFNSHTITSGLPTHTLVFLPKATGITIADGQDVNFVKGDGTCTKLSLQDGAEYEFLCDITANEAVYNRCNMTLKDITIKRGYNTDLTVNHYTADQSLTSYRDFSSFANGKNCFTIFLPYAVELPKGIRAYKLDLVKKEKIQVDEWTKKDFQYYMFNSISDGSTLDANRAYLLRITDGDTHSLMDFRATTPVQISASGTDKYTKRHGRLKPVLDIQATTSDKNYYFTGSTEKIPRDNVSPYTEDHPWTLSRDEKGKDLWKRMTESKGSELENKLIPPFRGIIMPKPGTTAAKQFVLLSEEEATGINDVTNDADAPQGVQRIYTIDGRFVGTDFDSLPSGMYIMKGKKTLKTK